MNSVSTGMDAVDYHEVLKRTLSCSSPGFHGMMLEFLHGTCSAAAIMPSSLAGVCIACGQHIFPFTIGSTLPVSQRRCYSRKSITVWNVDQRIFLCNGTSFTVAGTES